MMRVWILTLSLLLSSFALPLAAQSMEAGPTVIAGDLELQLHNIGGEVSGQLTIIDGQGEVLRDFSGPVDLVMNGEEIQAEFNSGYYIFEMSDDRVSSVRVEYLTTDGVEVLQQGIRTLGAGSRMGRFAPWTSILPPLIAIILALIFREVVISLLAGVATGAILLLGGAPSNWLPAIGDTFEYYILGSIADSSHASIILFSMMIGGMVAVISRNGGMYGVVDKLSKLANSARNTQLVTWLLGVAIFFDDYANTLVVGNTMRPVTDRFRISREKLAYIVDSTAAPVAAIAFITTWIGAELDYISGAIETLGISESAYSIFLNSLKYSYYPIFTLVFILMLIFMRRDFGTMLKAEQRARTTGQVAKPGNSRKHSDEDVSALDPEPGTRQLWYNAFIPVFMVIITTLIGLWTTGFQSLVSSGDPDFVNWGKMSFGDKLDKIFTTDMLSLIVGSSDSYIALIWASAAGVISAVAMSGITRTLPVRDAVEAVLDGFKTMIPAIVILVLAWSLATVTEHLHTASYLTGVFSDSLNPALLPAITFVFAGLISFSTGSSWSTMAILYPLVLPLTWSIGVANGMEAEVIMPIFYNVTATVLAGSVLGDHCSPISDTTILSSLATNCNHVDHVRTQLPYALTVGAVSLLTTGFLSVIGVPFFINFPLGLILLYLVVRFVGTPVPEPATDQVDQKG